MKFIPDCGKIEQWYAIMQQFRIHPKAVCRKLITALEDQKPLSNVEERKVIRAIESTGIPNGVDRMLAGLSVNTLKTLMGQM